MGERHKERGDFMIIQELLKQVALATSKTGNYSTAQTDTAIWTPATGKKIVLVGIVFSTDTAMNIMVENGSTSIIPPMYMAANGGAVISGGDAPIWVGDTDAVLTITSSATGNHSVLLYGYEI